MKHGILVISHGSRNTSWVDEVDQLVAAAKQQLLESAIDDAEQRSSFTLSSVPIYSAYLELVEGRLIQDGIIALENEGVAHIHVMPLFISSGSTHVEEIKQAFGFPPIHEFVGDLEPFEFSAEIDFADPIVDDEEIIAILLEQIEALSQTPTEEAVLLIGHGSSYPYFYQLWEEDMQHVVQKLQQHKNELRMTYASLLPEKARETLLQLYSEPSIKQVLVIPLFISSGYFINSVIPNRLEHLAYLYSGRALLPHPLMANLLCRRIKDMLQI